MSRWYRVFGTTATEPAPAALLQYLQGLGLEVTGSFSGDDLGWFRADLLLVGTEAPLRLERYLATEDGIRAELNSWAAWLETQEANLHHEPLMEQMIATAQVFTIHADDQPDADAEAVCTAACRFLAQATAGTYQVDGGGFFHADGALLVPEEA